MKRTTIFLGLMLAAASVFTGCTSTQVAPVQYAVSVSPVTGATVTVEPVTVRRGFDSFLLTVANTGSTDAVVVWEKSTIQYNNKSYRIFVENQSVDSIDRGDFALTIPAAQKISRKIYSADQLDFSQNTMSYDFADVSSDSIADDSSPSYSILPIRAESVTISLCVKIAGAEQTVTATIAPAPAASDTPSPADTTATAPAAATESPAATDATATEAAPTL